MRKRKKCDEATVGETCPPPCHWSSALLWRLNVVTLIWNRATWLAVRFFGMIFEYLHLGFSTNVFRNTIYFIIVQNIRIKIMSKLLGKRKSVVYKRQLAKRNWLLHRPRNPAKKLKKNFGKTKVDNEQVESLNSWSRFGQTIGFLTRRAPSCINSISTIEFLTRKLKSCVYTIALLLSYSSSLPIRLFRNCVSWSCFVFCRSLAVARERGERLLSAVLLSMNNGYSHFKRVCNIFALF